MKLYIVQKFDSWYDYGNVEEERFYKDKTKAELTIAGKNTMEQPALIHTRERKQN